jgi:hypothetical protein
MDLKMHYNIVMYFYIYRALQMMQIKRALNMEFLTI